jgi:hypothetical protein
MEIDIADKWKNRKVIEDALLNDKVLEIIKELHGEIFKIRKHYEIAGMETDVILLCKRERGYKSIGIELKQSDLLTAVGQAMERRQYFNYFYVISESYKPNVYIGYEIEWLSKFNSLSNLKKYKIGWIVSNFNNQAWLIYPSRYINVGFKNVLFKLNEENNI